jgi:hypothetical protein
MSAKLHQAESQGTDLDHERCRVRVDSCPTVQHRPSECTSRVNRNAGQCSRKNGHTVSKCGWNGGGDGLGGRSTFNRFDCEQVKSCESGVWRGRGRVDEAVYERFRAISQVAFGGHLLVKGVLSAHR